MRILNRLVEGRFQENQELLDCLKPKGQEILCKDFHTGSGCGNRKHGDGASPKPPYIINFHRKKKKLRVWRKEAENKGAGYG